MGNVLLRVVVTLLLLTTIKCSTPSEGDENNKGVETDTVQINHPRCSSPQMQTIMEENMERLEADLANGACTEDADENEAILPSSKYVNDKTKQEWAGWRRLIEIAEKEYKETKGQTLKCGKGSCDCYRFVIDKDLLPFSKGISSKMIEDAKPRGVLYQILDKKLYRDEDCKFPARCTGIEHFLLELIQQLPDMELVINVSDFPQIPNFDDSQKYVVPLLSFSKTSRYMDIFYPAWSFWDGGPSISLFPTGLGRWDLLRKSILKTSNKNAWAGKRSQAFFRGSRTSAERDPLILLSRTYPDLVDAKYTKNQAWRSDADTLHEPAASEVGFEDHCDFKYLFNYRGVSASFRFKHLFLCKSLVFHVGDEWEEFFYAVMKPWIHYIPVKKDSTQEELRSLIEFVQFHDSIAEKIAAQGYNFIKTNLRLSHVSCYWTELLNKYAQLLNYKVSLRKELIRVN